MRWIAQGLTIALLAFGFTVGALELAIRWVGVFDLERRLAAEGQAEATPAQNLEIPGAILHPYLGYTQRPGTSYGPPAAEEGVEER